MATKQEVAEALDRIGEAFGFEPLGIEGLPKGVPAKIQHCYIGRYPHLRPLAQACYEGTNGVTDLRAHKAFAQAAVDLAPPHGVTPDDVAGLARVAVGGEFYL